VSFTGAARCDVKDRSEELGFANLRSAAWWGLRERLDPAFGATLALPPDDRLTGDLMAPKWRMLSGGKIQVESKADIVKRLGRSPDDGDAVMMVLAAELCRSLETFGFPRGIGTLPGEGWRTSI
jgi:hypothetical protein